LKSKHQRPVVVVIFHTSIGEVQWILPYLHQLDSEGDYETVSFFFSKEVLEKVKRETVMYELLTNATKVYCKEHFFTFLFQNKSRVQVILKDFWPLSDGSLAAAIRKVCPQASLLLYPHAFALYSENAEGTPVPFVRGASKHTLSAYDGILLNAVPDRTHWSKQIPHDRIHIIGSLGYSRAWIRTLEAKGSDVANQIASVESTWRILFAIRGPWEGFLSEDDYDGLMAEALPILFDIKDAFIVIKPHPRQDLSELSIRLSAYPKERYMITFASALSIGHLIDFAVNFWSSVTLDLLALGKVSLEFYRFRHDGMWVTRPDGSYASYYEELGLVRSATTKEELRAAIDYLLANGLDDERTYRVKKFEQLFFTETAFKNFKHAILTIQRSHQYSASQRVLAWWQILASSCKSYLSGK
jgi:hypothetical protein